MKSRNAILTWFLALTITISFGQTKDPVLMKVGNNEVTREEFKAIFTKNLKDSVITQQALDEYMVLFTKFKLKVTEAESMGLDTTRKFREELAGYRKQLSRPYMTDVTTSEELVKEAYERMKEEIRASHILVKCESDAMPKDTLAAYKKAVAFRERLIKGEDFATVATGKSGSEDPSAAKNGGDIGYFTALQMVYPFEKACYKMKVGDISQPIRTKFGYHIIKITDRRPARGQVKVAHILISSKDEDDPIAKETALKKANELLSKIKAGEDFAGLAKQFSDDQSSAKKGGELQIFGPGKMVMEFENASFSLKNVGDVSELVKSSYGYHIIKLLEKIPVQTFDEMKGQLKQKISRDTRSVIPKAKFIEKLKKKYKYKETLSTLDMFYAGVDTSILQNRWRKEYLMATKAYVRPKGTSSSTDQGLIKEKKEEVKPTAEIKEIIPVDEKKVAAMKKTVMFTFADKKFSQYDFAEYLENNQRQDKEADMKKYILGSFRSWTQDELNAYEDSQLEILYPEFRLLMKEYRDGILLFELTDQKVWNKAVKDTSGLRSFYNENKSKYMWGVRYDSEIYTCATAEIANNLSKDLTVGYIEKEKVQPKEEAVDDKKGKSKKSKSKSKNTGPEMEKIPVTVDVLKEKYNKDSQLNLKVESGKFSKDDKEILSSTNLQSGISQVIQKDGQFIVVRIKEVLPPMNKTLNESKGVVTADYQSFLEAKWIEELQAKYKVEVFKDVLYSIK